MDYQDIRNQLTTEIDDKYQEFVSRGTPTERPILGIRIPIIRRIAKSVPREDIEKIISVEPFSFEEVLLRGMLIARLPYSDMFKYFDSQIDLIGDWGACDVFCSSLRPHLAGDTREGGPPKMPSFLGEERVAGPARRAEFLDQKIEKLLKSNQEFPVRVGLVLLLTSYVDPDYLPLIFDRIESLKDREEYYVKMAIAWLLAECFAKFPEETLGYLKVSKLPKWTFNKTISKICDSYRVEDDMKDYLKTLRKK